VLGNVLWLFGLIERVERVCMRVPVLEGIMHCFFFLQLARMARHGAWAMFVLGWPDEVGFEIFVWMLWVGGPHLAPPVGARRPVCLVAVRTGLFVQQVG